MLPIPTTNVLAMAIESAERLEDLAGYPGLLHADFRVAEPSELVAQLRVLAARFAAAAGPG